MNRLFRRFRKGRVRAMNEKLNEEGYYRDLIKKHQDKENRSERRLIKIFHAWRWFGHLTWLHYWKDTKEIQVDGRNYRIVKCKVCGKEGLEIDVHQGWPLCKRIIATAFTIVVYPLMAKVSGLPRGFYVPVFWMGFFMVLSLIIWGTIQGFAGESYLD